MPVFKPAYLIHGDDHGRLAERRAKLKAMAETSSGSGGVEVLEGDACTPDRVAMAIDSMTFAMGRRFVIADGVERWKDGDVGPVATALKGMDPEALTVAFFAREEGRYSAPKKLHVAVQAAGGTISEEATVKPWELPKWVVARGAEVGVRLDNAAAKALVVRVGDRQQRLLRELEKLALSHGPDAVVSEDDILAEAAGSAERKVWTLSDALVAGDTPVAVRVFLDLRAQGERVPALLYRIVNQFRSALQVAEALAAGQSTAQAKRGLRMSPKQADKLIAAVREREVEHFRRALEQLADLELLSRGGGELSEDTETAKFVVGTAA